MDENVSNNHPIDQKMAKMRLKNLELLKRHQEIEEDRQLAGQSSEAMRSTKSRARPILNPQIDPSYERTHRAPIRRKFETDRTDTPPQRAQRVDYNRLKRERAQEFNTYSKPSQLQDYTFHNQSETNYRPFPTKSDFHHSETDGPSQAKKLVFVNNKANRIGSGRFNQQQRTQEKVQRKREEQMHRTTTSVQSGGNNEFHLDISPISMWPNAPMHVQLIPHHTGLDHLINTSAEQIDQPTFIHNFVYSTPTPTTPFSNNGTVYFPQPPQTHFHQFHPTRTFENTNRHPYHLPAFQTSPIFPPPQSATIPHSLPTPTDNPSPVHFRHLKTPEYEPKSRPMSTNFERLHNTHPHPPQRFQSRPQSFYEFSSNNNNNINSKSTNFVRSQRTNLNNNTSLPLSAYMGTDNSDANHRFQRRKVPPRTYHQDKHQFPLSSYDISQYTFSNASQRRADGNHSHNHRHRPDSNGNRNEVDLIEEWWEDNETELLGTKPTTTTVDDSGNSSLSTSMHLKETTTDEFANPPSDVSTTDSNIIESLDKLQQQLKLEEAVDERLASKDLTPYDTAHFMQWAKETFREELAGRLTAQEIEQHDAVTSEDDENPSNQLDHLEEDLHEKLTIESNQSK